MLPMHVFPKIFAASKIRTGRSLRSSIVALRSVATIIDTVPCNPRITTPVCGNATIESMSCSFSTAPARREMINGSQSFDTVVHEDFENHLLVPGQRSENWYTGVHPSECVGFHNNVLYSVPQLSAKTSRQELQKYFDNTWTLTEVLFASLKTEESFMIPPKHELRHPMIFYYGHTAALYVNKLMVAGLLKHHVNQYYEEIFETGVDEMSWDDLSKNQMTWPSVEDVHKYRKVVYELVKDMIASLADEDCAEIHNGHASVDTKSGKLWALLMGFEHERIHLETSAMLINEMPLSYVQVPKYFPEYHNSVRQTLLTPSERKPPQIGIDYPENSYIPITPAKELTLGKPRDAPSFGWDNEYGNKVVRNLAPFEASKFLCSNGEFLEFLKDNGYATRAYWTDAGWKWRAYRNSKWPVFWVRDGPQGIHYQFKLRLLFSEVEMPWDHPVIVNLHEAQAYATWKTMKENKQQDASNMKTVYRVSTELEHHAMRDSMDRCEVHNTKDIVLSYEGDGKHMLESCNRNANLSVGSMMPVHGTTPNEAGIYDVFGNAWHWCIDTFSPLHDFDIHPFYEDFSTPCFDGLHHVIMGGSFISTGNLSSKYARYHFRPHFYQQASFRLVKQQIEVESGTSDKDLMECYKVYNRKIMTSDTDSPGPYVGNYPFRRSAESYANEQECNTQFNNNNSSSNSSRISLNTQVQYHYGVDNLHSFKGLANDVHRYMSGLKTKNTLVVGCGPGGLVMELANLYNQSGLETNQSNTLIGMDFDEHCIDIAKQMKTAYDAGRTHTGVSIELVDEGNITNKYEVKCENMTKLSEIEFRHADPMCLPAELAGFDGVVLYDVIDKMASPNGLLNRLGGLRGLVKPEGGLVFLLSTYSWDETITPKSLWLGGNVDAGSTSNKSSFDTLYKKLTTPSDVSGGNDTMNSGFELIYQNAKYPMSYKLTEKREVVQYFDFTVWKRL